MLKVWEQEGHVFVQGIVINHHFSKILSVLDDAARKNRSIVLDLKELEFIDESGVQLLLKQIEEVQKRGTRIELTNVQEKVMSEFLKVSLALWLSEKVYSRAG